MNLFFDTNLWVRYFVGDNKDQMDQVKGIIESVLEGDIRLATSTFILSELVYVETSFYKIPKKHIIEDLELIRSVRNILIIEETSFSGSYDLYKKYPETHAKWSDCVITSQVPPSYKLCSFDERLKSLIGKERFLHPKEVGR